MTTTAIVGAKFRPPASDVLNNLPGETKLFLIREPENPYDANAIKVVLVIDPGKDPDLVDLINGLCDGDEYPENWQMDWMEAPYYFHCGYVPRTDAEVLAPHFDNLAKKVSQAVVEIPPVPGKLMFTMEGRPAVEFDLEEETQT